jgi:hypothetical protein
LFCVTDLPAEVLDVVTGLDSTGDDESGAWIIDAVGVAASTIMWQGDDGDGADGADSTGNGTTVNESSVVAVVGRVGMTSFSVSVIEEMRVVRIPDGCTKLDISSSGRL